MPDQQQPDQQEDGPVKRPASQYYWGDWWKDKGLQSCSQPARGLWHEMNTLMHEGEPYGHLTVNKKPMTVAQLANLCRITHAKCKALVDELVAAGVPSTDPTTGALFSRRMVRDERIRNARAAGGKGGAEHGAKGAEHGKKGGRPPKSEGGEKTPLPPAPNPPPSSSSASSPSVRTPPPSGAPRPAPPPPAPSPSPTPAPTPAPSPPPAPTQPPLVPVEEMPAAEVDDDGHRVRLPGQVTDRPLAYCPKRFRVTKELVQWAGIEYPILEIPDLRKETEAFRNHKFRPARERWEATWKNWIKTAAENKARRARPGAGFTTVREQQIAQHMPNIAAAPVPAGPPPGPPPRAPLAERVDGATDAEPRKLAR
jgi:hypothetical protein